MSTVITDSYSDQDMQCPADWENGYKPARIVRWGDSEFALSHPWSGEWQGSRFTYVIADKNGVLRAQLASQSDRYWTRPETVRMTSRANRAVKGQPYTVFHGPVIDVQAQDGKRQLTITLGDIVSQVLFSDQSDKFRIPWRVIGEGFLDQMDAISENLDRETPEPIIYGRHNRTATSLATATGFRIRPTYLGRWTINGTQYHVGLLAGHACANVDLYLDGILTAEGSDWLIPTHAGWLAAFGAPYIDIPSSVYGYDRRYSLILGVAGNADPDDWALGEKVLTCDVDGVETNGNGTGELITDIYQQRKHFDINFVACAGPASYQSGAWLTNPVWDIFGTSVQIIDEDSYDAATAIGIERKPDSDGIQGAAVIGRAAGDRYNAPKWDADWNRSSAARSAFTRHGQKRIALLHPTAAIKAAAPLFSDALHITKDSFKPSLRWGDHANSIPYRGDRDPDGDVWRTTGTRTNDQSILNYERVIPSETREYPFAPGPSNCSHLAGLEVAVRNEPTRGIELDTSVSVQSQDGISLASLGPGDYFRYVHFDAIQETRSIRLAQVEKPGVRVGRRRISVEAIDCEDLIGYDENIPADATSLATLCAMALPIDELVAIGDEQDWVLDTSAHPTDDSVAGLMPGPGIAYSAAWWEFIAPLDATLILNTLGSLYNTQMAVFTGACDAPELYDYNDGAVRGWVRRAYLETPVFAGETYRILIAGYGPTDGGTLKFQARLEDP